MKQRNNHQFPRPLPVPANIPIVGQPQPKQFRLDAFVSHAPGKVLLEFNAAVVRQADGHPVFPLSAAFARKIGEQLLVQAALAEEAAAAGQPADATTPAPLDAPGTKDEEPSREK